MANRNSSTLLLLLFGAGSWTVGAEHEGWWNARWRLRTTVTRPTPCRDAAGRPVEVPIDFPLLLQRAGVPGQFDPASVRVVERGPAVSPQDARALPCALRTEIDAEGGPPRPYLTWLATPQAGRRGTYDIYFDTKERRIEAARYAAALLPADNLLANPGFEDAVNGLPAGWEVTPGPLVSLSRFPRTTGRRSLRIGVDGKTPADAGRDVRLSQKVDVRRHAGQEMVFECDLLAERALYGAPVCIELQQLRADGSRIPEFAVDPRWLAIELAQGQWVQLRERGKLSPEAATLDLVIRARCSATDADSGKAVTGPESFFTVWIDRLVVRVGERWLWPAASPGGFVEGALPGAPLNRGFEFAGLRRVAFNGASEGTLTSNSFYDSNPRVVHWGLDAGTLEFWCRPSWSAADGVEHVFFYGVAYMHRMHSCLRKLDAAGGNQLEFAIADSSARTHRVRGPAPLQAGRWHHVAATWDFAKAHLQLFVDGRPVGAEGPGSSAWPFSMVAAAKGLEGMGIDDGDARSLPMQAFIGGDHRCSPSAAADAVLDELRVSSAVRYAAPFAPARDEFPVDAHTRALFHFENECHGVHDSDDRFVRGHLACELPPQDAGVTLDVYAGGKVERRVAAVLPPESKEQFEASRVENRVPVTRPVRETPDPRFVEYRERRFERIIGGREPGFTIPVGGDFEPLMRSITFERAEGAPPAMTLLPRLRANDNVVPFSVESIAATLGSGSKSEAEKAFRVFEYAVRTTDYYDGGFCETLPGGRHRPRTSYTLLKALNIYPFDQCGPMNHMLRKLFLAAGISSNNASGTHHQFEQAFYGGSWRLFDLSPRLFWLNRDNTTVASRRAFEEDLYLKLRQGTEVCSGLQGRKGAATFGRAERPHDMSFPLRSGERVSFCWHNEGRWFELKGNREPLSLARIPPFYGNGVILYEPTLLDREPNIGDALPENLTLLDGTTLRAEDPSRPASLIYQATCPYILSDAVVRGSYAAAAAGAIHLSVSLDEGKSWTDVWSNSGPSGEIEASLLPHVSARYAYWLKVSLAPGATVRGLSVRTTFVAAPRTLPETLARGENRIRLAGTPPAVPVKVTYRWTERYRSDLGVSLNALSYEHVDDTGRRNVFVAAPGGSFPLRVMLTGRALRGEVLLEGLPAAWEVSPRSVPVDVAAPNARAEATFTVRAGAAALPGQTLGFNVLVKDGGRERRVPAQVLVADCPLAAAECMGVWEYGSVGAQPASHTPTLPHPRTPTLSGAEGQRAFDLTAPRDGKYALWIHARWSKEGSSPLTVAVDDASRREVRPTAMIGFTDWSDPSRAHTKSFAHSFDGPYAHWAWYRIPDVEVARGSRRLTLGVRPPASLDAVVLLPQDAATDRAAMDLFQNWSYAPWENPW